MFCFQAGDSQSNDLSLVTGVNVSFCTLVSRKGTLVTGVDNSRKEVLSQWETNVSFCTVVSRKRTLVTGVDNSSKNLVA